MLVRTIKDTAGENPDYNPKQKADRATNNPARVVPTGTEIEHPDAWMLCLPHYDQAAVAEPVDDEAKQKLASFEAAAAKRSRKPAAKLKFPPPAGKRDKKETPAAS